MVSETNHLCNIIYNTTNAYKVVHYTCNKTSTDLIITKPCVHQKPESRWKQNTRSNTRKFYTEFDARLSTFARKVKQNRTFIQHALLDGIFLVLSNQPIWPIFLSYSTSALTNITFWWTLRSICWPDDMELTAENDPIHTISVFGRLLEIFFFSVY